MEQPNRNTSKSPGRTTEAPTGYGGIGYLTVKVSTAREAIPIENALVQIRSRKLPEVLSADEGTNLQGGPYYIPVPQTGEENENIPSLPEGNPPLISSPSEARGNLIAVLRTDRSGLTQKLSLPTPLRALSESPSSPVPPYALYDIDVTFPGYRPEFHQKVPIFDTILSLQSIELIPLSDGSIHLPNEKYDTRIYEGDL